MDRKLSKKYYFIILTIILTLLLLHSIQLDYGFPKGMDYVEYYIDHGVEETGAVNFVASIYLDYRAYDTLMETIVLFMAVTGVILFLWKEK